MHISGPVGGGTSIKVRGTDLGVTFYDIQNADISLGGVPCIASSNGYIPGEQFVCETANFSITGNKYFSLKIGTKEAVSDLPFEAVFSTVTDIFPTFGPVAGGTMVSIVGTNLDVGNQENTTAYLEINGANFSCIIQ